MHVFPIPGSQVDEKNRKLQVLDDISRDKTLVVLKIDMTMEKSNHFEDVSPI